VPQNGFLYMKPPLKSHTGFFLQWRFILLYFILNQQILEGFPKDGTSRDQGVINA
jgi:hypothetical protein